MNFLCFVCLKNYFRKIILIFLVEKGSIKQLQENLNQSITSIIYISMNDSTN